ncbi:MAG: hypothetical protein Q9168_003549 [Polycauliona sp. 1 TL-2023]
MEHVATELSRTAAWARRTVGTPPPVYEYLKDQMSSQDVVDEGLILAVCEEMIQTIMSHVTNPCTDIANGNNLSIECGLRASWATQHLEAVRHNMGACKEVYKQNLAGDVDAKVLPAGSDPNTISSSTTGSSSEAQNTVVRAKSIVLLFSILLSFTIKLGILIHLFETSSPTRRDIGTLANFATEERIWKEGDTRSEVAEHTTPAE